MICASCGKRNNDQAKFCASCGRALNEKKAEADNPQITGADNTSQAPVRLPVVNLVAVIKENETERSDDIYPVFLTGWKLKLAEDEQVIWQGNAAETFQYSRNEQKGLKTGWLDWKTEWMLKNVYVFITNQRIVYLCKKYKKGQTWRGWGTIGVLFALFMMLITALWAMYRRHGKAAAGQIRYQWPIDIFHEYKQEKAYQETHITALLQDAQKTYRICFIIKSWPDESIQTVQKMISAIAAFRLRLHGAKLTKENEEKLLKLKKQPEGKIDDNGKRIITDYEIPKTLKVPLLKFSK